LLAPSLGELLADHARQQVGGAASGKSNDITQCLWWIVRGARDPLRWLCLCIRQCYADRQCANTCVCSCQLWWFHWCILPKKLLSSLVVWARRKDSGLRHPGPQPSQSIAPINLDTRRGAACEANIYGAIQPCELSHHCPHW